MSRSGRYSGKVTKVIRVHDLRAGDSIYGFLARTSEGVVVRIIGWVLDGLGDPDGDEIIFYQHIDHPGERREVRLIECNWEITGRDRGPL